MNRKNVAAILAISLFYVLTDLGMTTFLRRRLHPGIPVGRFGTCARRPPPIAFHPLIRPERKLMFPGKCTPFILPTCQAKIPQKPMFILPNRNPQLLPRCPFNRKCPFPSIHRPPPFGGTHGIVPPAPGGIFGPIIQRPVPRPVFPRPYPQLPPIPTLPQQNYYPQGKPPIVLNIYPGKFNTPQDVQDPKVTIESPGTGSEIEKEPNLPNKPPGLSLEAEREKNQTVDGQPNIPNKQPWSSSESEEDNIDERQPNTPNEQPWSSSETDSKEGHTDEGQPNIPNEQAWSSSETDTEEGHTDERQPNKPNTKAGSNSESALEKESVDEQPNLPNEKPGSRAVVDTKEGITTERQPNIPDEEHGSNSESDLKKELDFENQPDLSNGELRSESESGEGIIKEEQPSLANGQTGAGLEFEIEKNLTIGNLGIEKILSINGGSGKGLDFLFENEIKFGKK